MNRIKYSYILLELVRNNNGNKVICLFCLCQTLIPLLIIAKTVIISGQFSKYSVIARDLPNHEELKNVREKIFQHYLRFQAYRMTLLYIFTHEKSCNLFSFSGVASDPHGTRRVNEPSEAF